MKLDPFFIMEEGTKFLFGIDERTYDLDMNNYEEVFDFIVRNYGDDNVIDMGGIKTPIKVLWRDLRIDELLEKTRP